jgi:large subunit ribosomal protein L17
MRHQKKSRRFGRSPAHRKAMFRNMVTSLFIHERVLTTVEKAKELRRVAERLITLGKRGDLSARRLAASKLQLTGQKEGQEQWQEETALRKLFDTLAPRYKERMGGYTRIIKTGNRVGDCAQMAYIELIPEEKKAPPAGKKEPGKKAPAKAKTAAAAKKKTAAPKAKAAAHPKAKAKKAKDESADE